MHARILYLGSAEDASIHDKSNTRNLQRGYKRPKGYSNACAIETAFGARACTGYAQNLILDPECLIVVIVLSMGSAKKKPMTKKEREERRKRHKEKRLKK